ncbi:MAG TPA: SRPBCC family protein [Mycobacteriales bacterium]|nr:SRPBCC family protein [Mycobacteriales bacterium]
MTTSLSDMIEVSTTIDASPEQVWELIGDPARMGEWSPECHRVTWLGRLSAPAVGARFRGYNRIGRRRWATVGTVSVYEPGHAVAWEVHAGPLPVAHWGYRIEPADGGCTVTETFEDHRGMLIRVVGSALRGVGDTEAHNRAGMAATLARVKAAAEAPAIV